MGRKARAAATIAAGVLVAIQFVPIERTNPPVEQVIAAPPQIRAVLERSCYDCHSNLTQWPWYSRVAPVSWLVAHDVEEAREHLDFTAWNRIEPRKRAKVFDEIAEEVEEGAMPLWYYEAVHPHARLSDRDRAALVQWAQQEMARSEPSGSPGG